MITEGCFGQIFHGAICLRFLFQRKLFRTVHNEMDFILIEMHFMVVLYLLKTRGGGYFYFVIIFSLFALRVPRDCAASSVFGVVAHELLAMAATGKQLL